METARNAHSKQELNQQIKAPYLSVKNIFFLPFLQNAFVILNFYLNGDYSF